MKKDKSLPNKNIHINNSSGKPLRDNYNRNHPAKIIIAEDLQTEEVHKISHRIDIAGLIQNNQYRNNYSDRSNYSNCNRNRSHSKSRNSFIQTNVLEISHIIETETIQIVELDSTQIIDHEFIQTIDQTITLVT